MKIAINCLDFLRVSSAVVFVVIILVFGIPIWWKATEVYRVNLPSPAIRKLNHTSYKIKINLKIFTFETNYSKKIISGLQQNFLKEDFWDIDFNIIEAFPNQTNFATAKSLEKNIRKMDTNKYFLILEWPMINKDIILTSERSMLITRYTDVEKIHKTLSSIVFQSQEIEALFNIGNHVPYERKMRSLENEILVTLIISNPDEMKIDWDTRKMAESYLKKFTDEFAPIINSIIKTQRRYQMSLETFTKMITDPSLLGRHYALSYDTLHQVVTTIEKRLGSDITDKQFTHIIVYIPSCSLSPIFMYDSNGQLLNNSVQLFSSSDWGGVLIYNLPTEKCLKFMENSEKFEHELHFDDIKNEIIYLLYKFAGTKTQFAVNNIIIENSSEFILRKWEYDTLVMKNTVDYLTKASHTLISLINLLDDISYIVITDEVGKAINDAYYNIVEGRKKLQNAEIMEAFQNAKEAFVSSEKAFFDASLLAQLYFPDEQKYAIYIPLFLPVMVPVFTSLFMIRKWFSERKQIK